MRDLRRLFRDGSLTALGDAELLGRFVARRDELAFEVLVARHGPMVHAVCSALIQDPEGVDDAFQATFLILVKKAGTIRGGEALGGWLHRVAHRVAVRANIEAGRRRARERSAGEMIARESTGSRTGDDLRPALHEEIGRLPEKYRRSVVLCHLQGLTHAQAAEELRCGEATLRRRLAAARQRLRLRLSRRGVALSGTAMLAALAQDARAALPAARVESMVQAVTTGSVSATASTLTSQVLRSMLIAKLKIGAATCLTVAGIGWIASGTIGRVAARDKAPAPPSARANTAISETATPPGSDADAVKSTSVKGHVVGPDDKPVAGAKLIFAPTGKPNAQTVGGTSAADGSFQLNVEKSSLDKVKSSPYWERPALIAFAPGFGPDWVDIASVKQADDVTLRLVKDDVPISGRVLDLQGRPVAGANVELKAIEAMPEGNLKSFLDTWRVDAQDALRLAKKYLPQPDLAGVRSTVRTDTAGRFRISGIGRERIALIRIEAAAIEHTEVHVLTRNAVDVKDLNASGPKSMQMPGRPSPSIPLIYAASFEHLGGPTRPVTGTVREKGTRKPLADIQVSGSIPFKLYGATTKTDSEGRFRLVGLGKGRLHVYAAAPEAQALLPAFAEVSDAEGLDPTTVDIELSRGITVRGKVTDKTTGSPVRGHVVYHTLAGNPLNDDPRLNAEVGADGTYRVVVPPGIGGIFVSGQDPTDNHRVHFVQAHRAQGDKTIPFAGTRMDDMISAGGGSAIMLSEYCAYRVIEPGADEGSLNCEFQPDPGVTRAGMIVDPDGQPLNGATIHGRSAIFDPPFELPTAGFNVLALEPNRTRNLFAVHPKRQLAGYLSIRGDERSNVSLRLEPWAEVKGRAVGEDGRPLGNAMVRMTYSGPDGYMLPGLSASAFPCQEMTTDKDGAFHLEGLVPGIPFSLSLMKDGRFYDDKRLKAIEAKPGETKDLGDVGGNLMNVE
jgi:RNA polymerase sigma factor (sigma-70 family)